MSAAVLRSGSVHSFCWVLVATGCRISEALAISDRDIDFEAGHIVIECLKKRGKKVFRTVPLPPGLLDLIQRLLDAGELPRQRLWPWSRMTGYRRVREVMVTARIKGIHASPKGLRHAFGVCAIQANVPLNLVQRWLGHSDIKTTTIYTDAMGAEEREFASRIWMPEGGRLATRRRSPKRGCASDSSRLGSPTGTLTDSCFEPSSERNGSYDTSLLRLATALNHHVSRAINHPGSSRESSSDHSAITEYPNRGIATI